MSESATTPSSAQITAIKIGDVVEIDRVEADKTVGIVTEKLPNEYQTRVIVLISVEDGQRELNTAKERCEKVTGEQAELVRGVLDYEQLTAEQATEEESS